MTRLWTIAKTGTLTLYWSCKHGAWVESEDICHVRDIYTDHERGNASLPPGGEWLEMRFDQ